MARKPQIKSGLAEARGPNEGLKKAAIVKVSSSGEILKDEADSIFLLNPSSYEENKTSNWIPNNVPGQSHPVYQWVSGGPRIVTFECLVTKESSHFLRPKDSNLWGSFVDSATKVVGDIASSFAGIDLPPITDLFPIDAPGAGNDLSIAATLDYYRSLMYPTYTADYKLSNSPPLIVLITGDTFSRFLAGEKYSAPGSSGSYLPVWVVTNLNIRIIKQLPNLHPMEAFVTFTLHEYPTKSVNISNFVKSNIPSSLGITDIAGSVMRTG